MSDSRRDLAWRKSTFSSPNPDCVEVALDGGTAHVRDTKNRGGPVLSFDPAAWAAFLDGVRNGEFD